MTECTGTGSELPLLGLLADFDGSSVATSTERRCIFTEIKAFQKYTQHLSGDKTTPSQQVHLDLHILICSTREYLKVCTVCVDAQWLESTGVDDLCLFLRVHQLMQHLLQSTEANAILYHLQGPKEEPSDRSYCSVDPSPVCFKMLPNGTRVLGLVLICTCTSCCSSVVRSSLTVSSLLSSRLLRVLA